MEWLLLDSVITTCRTVIWCMQSDVNAIWRSSSVRLHLVILKISLDYWSIWSLSAVYISSIFWKPLLSWKSHLLLQIEQLIEFSSVEYCNSKWLQRTWYSCFSASISLIASICLTEFSVNIPYHLEALLYQLCRNTHKYEAEKSNPNWHHLYECLCQ